MFGEFSKLAIPLAITGVIGACTADGLACLLPLIVMGGVIYAAFHMCKELAGLDQKRNRR